MPVNDASASPAAPGKARLLSWQRITTPSAVLIATTAGSNVLRIANTMVLTRLLAPSDFGLVGMITSVFFVMALLTDVGFQVFIVRHERGDEPHFLNAVWSVHITRGVINAAILILLSEPIALLLDKPRLAPLLAVASLTIAIDGTASLTLLTALRRGLVRRLSMVDLGAFITQIVIGVIACAIFRNAWGIIVAMLASSAVKSAASYALFPESRRRFGFDRAVTSELWAFSRTIALSSMLTLLLAQVDKLVLARLFTLSQFGIYAIASTLAIAPAGIVGLYVPRIVYPQIARAWREHPSSIRSAYYGARGIIFYGYLIAAGGMIGCGPLVMRILYDPRYANAGGGIYLQWLAVAAATQMIARYMQDALIAVGRQRATLLMNVARVIWLAIGGTIGFVQFGPIGLVATLGLIEVPAYFYGAWVLRRIDILSIRRELLSIATIVLGAAAGFVLDFATLAVFH
jgi:O-antigen/teichoic acid export membrane protein